MATTVNETVKDLVIINHDRYQGYKKAAEETKDADLKSLFTLLSTQSLEYAQDLKQHLDAEDAADLDLEDTKLSGKLYRVYMDLKSAITGRDRKAILSSCEYGEDVALQHYNEAMEDLHDGNGYSADVIDKIHKQYAEIKQAHDRVKLMRDSL
ncbi:MAG: PA2169 family four-helix-bundle protein [Saprospiraceae bacterium]